MPTLDPAEKETTRKREHLASAESTKESHSVGPRQSEQTLSPDDSYPLRDSSEEKPLAARLGSNEKHFQDDSFEELDIEIGNREQDWGTIAADNNKDLERSGKISLAAVHTPSVQPRKPPSPDSHATAASSTEDKGEGSEKGGKVERAVLKDKAKTSDNAVHAEVTVVPVSSTNDTAKHNKKGGVDDAVVLKGKEDEAEGDVFEEEESGKEVLERSGKISLAAVHTPSVQPRKPASPDSHATAASSTEDKGEGSEKGGKVDEAVLKDKAKTSDNAVEGAMSTMNEKQEEMLKEAGKPPKISRVKIAGSNVGGYPIPSQAQASTTIQSCWRGKQVRRRSRLCNIAATIVQAVVRRALCHKKFKGLQAAHRRMQRDDQERRQRLRRIQEKEKELMLLRSLPAADYFRLDQIRSDHAAKTIQRQWRRGRSSAKAVGVDSVYETEQDTKTKNLVKLLQAASHRRASVAKERNSSFSYTIECDALGLAQLQRRISEAARKRLKENNEARDNVFARTGAPFGRNDESIDFTRVISRDRGKKDMQRLLELQQTCGVWLDEYCEGRHRLLISQEARLKSLGHCKQMLQQTDKLPTLDEAKAQIKLAGKESKSWLSDEDVTGDGLEVAVAAHLRTLHAVTHRDRWNIVAPHDITGPPLDITTLPSVSDAKAKDRRLDKLASLWAGGTDAEESLWWVSFASQLPEQRTRKVTADVDEHILKEEKLMGYPSEDVSQATAYRLIGEVDGHKLLQEATKDFLRAKDRKAATLQAIQTQREREMRVAAVFEQEATEAQRRARAVGALSEHSEAEKRRRDAKATKIQAVVRGGQSRCATRAQISEARMLDAIRVLLAELGQGQSQGPVQLGMQKIGQLKGFLSRLPGAQDRRGLSDAKKHLKEDVSKVVSAQQTPDSLRFARLRSEAAREHSVLQPLPQTSAQKQLASSTVSSSKGQTVSPLPLRFEEIGMKHFDQDQAALAGIGFVSPPSRSSVDLDVSAFSDDLQPLSMSPSFSPSNRTTPGQHHDEREGVPHGDIELPLASLLSVHISSTPKDSLRAMEFIEASLRKKTLQLDMGGLLTADLSIYERKKAQEVLCTLSMSCGSTPLRRWLQRFCPVTNECKGEREREVLVLDIEQLVQLLGGLAEELQPSGSTTEKLRELACLLRLLAPGQSQGDRGMVRLWDIAVLLEDDWLKRECPALLLPLATCRHAVMLQALRSRADPYTVARTMFGCPDPTAFVTNTALTAALQRSTCFKALSQAGELASALLGVCAWIQGATEVRCSTLTDWLVGPIQSYREAQQRLHFMCRAVPSASKYFSQQFLPSTVNKSTTVSAARMFQILLNGPLPMTSCDAFAVVQLLGRGAGGDDVDPAGFVRICKGEILQASMV